MPILTVMANLITQMPSLMTRMMENTPIRMEMESQTLMTPISKNLMQVLATVEQKAEENPMLEAKVKAKDKDRDKAKVRVKVRVKVRAKVKVKEKDKDKAKVKMVSKAKAKVKVRTASKGRAKTKAHNPVRMAKKVNRVRMVNRVSNRTTDKASNRMGMSKEDSKTPAKPTKTATIKTVRTSNSKGRHRMVSRANRVLSQTSNKVSNLIIKRITATMITMATAFRTILITMTTMTAYPMHKMTPP
jgi:hypothetical protein